MKFWNRIRRKEDSTKVTPPGLSDPPSAGRIPISSAVCASSSTSMAPSAGIDVAGAMDGQSSHIPLASSSWRAFHTRGSHMAGLLRGGTGRCTIFGFFAGAESLAGFQCPQASSSSSELGGGTSRELEEGTFALAASLLPNIGGDGGALKPEEAPGFGPGYIDPAALSLAELHVDRPWQSAWNALFQHATYPAMVASEMALAPTLLSKCSWAPEWGCPPSTIVPPASSTPLLLSPCLLQEP